MAPELPDDQLAIWIWTKIALGELPRVREDMASRFGEGETCTACGVIIAPRAAMYEGRHGTRTVFLHRACYETWSTLIDDRTPREPS